MTPGHTDFLTFCLVPVLVYASFIIIPRSQTQSGWDVGKRSLWAFSSDPGMTLSLFGLLEATYGRVSGHVSYWLKYDNTLNWLFRMLGWVMYNTRTFRLVLLLALGMILMIVKFILSSFWRSTRICALTDLFSIHFHSPFTTHFRCGCSYVTSK